MFRRFVGVAALAYLSIGSVQAADAYYPLVRALFGANQSTIRELARECQGFSGQVRQSCEKFVDTMGQDLVRAVQAANTADRTRNGPGPGVTNEEWGLRVAASYADNFAYNLASFYENLPYWRKVQDKFVQK